MEYFLNTIHKEPIKNVENESSTNVIWNEVNQIWSSDAVIKHSLKGDSQKCLKQTFEEVCMK